MWMYVLLILLPAIVCCYRPAGQLPGKAKRYSVTLFFLILLLMVSCRAINVGTDTASYRSIFYRFAGQSFRQVLQYKEPAFSLLCKLISCFTMNCQVMFIVSALISLLPILFLYREEIEYPVLTMALFVTMPTFCFLFSGIRQAIAIGLGVIAFDFVRKKKLLPFALTVALAFLFHRSAFILALMYPAYHIRLKKESLIFIVPILALIFIFNRQIFSFLRMLLRSYEGIKNVYTGQVTMLILFVLFSIFSFFIVRDSELDADTMGMRNFLLLITAIQMFAPLNTLAMRMGYYYQIFLPIAIPKVIACRDNRLRYIAKLALVIMTVFFLTRFFLIEPKKNPLNIFPYQFFFGN